MLPPDYRVKCSDELLVEVSCRDAYLRVSCAGVMSSSQKLHIGSMDEAAAAAEVPSKTELELCSALAGLQTHHDLPAQSFTLECSEITLLNNIYYHECFGKAMSKLLSSFESRGSEVKEEFSSSSSGPLFVLDVSEGFSVLSLMAARLGPVRAYSSVEKQHHRALLQLLARENGVHEDALEFWLGHVEDDSAVLQRPDSEKLWSAIVLDCVEICGLLRQNLMEKATLAR